MVEVKIKFDPEENASVEEFLMELALRKRYRSALFDLSHNMWRKWKHDESDLSVDILREEIARVLLDNGLSYEDLE
jgi:hypothetical protein